MPRRGLFLTGTGTGVGKTWVSRGLLAASRRAGRPCPGVKPLETGCAPDPLDALALERAAGVPGTARAPGLYRARLPAAPWAATLAGEPPPPPVSELADRVAALVGDRGLVEGAGGWLVPLDATRDVADLQRALGLPAVVVAPDRLGVLSDTLALAAVARARQLPLAGVVLVAHPDDADDPTRATNARILEARLAPAPVWTFPACEDDDDALAAAAETHLGALVARLTG